MAHAGDDNLYIWAKKSTLLKSGRVVFQTDLGMTIMNIAFTDAYCINLTREINALTGTKTTLIISPNIIIMDGVEHENHWIK